MNAQFVNPEQNQKQKTNITPNPKIQPPGQKNKEIIEPVEKDEPSEIITQAAAKESEKRRRGIGQDYELDGQGQEPVIPSVSDRIQTGMSGPNKTSANKTTGDMPKEGQM